MRVVKNIPFFVVLAALSSCLITFFANGMDFYRSNVFGYRLSFVLSESMEPTLMTHALCLTDLLHRDYDVGDIVVYEHQKDGVNLLICHRIKDIQDGHYIMRGDNNHTDDPWDVKKEDIVGKVIGTSNGFAKIYNALFGITPKKGGKQ